MDKTRSSFQYSHEVAIINNIVKTSPHAVWIFNKHPASNLGKKHNHLKHSSSKDDTRKLPKKKWHLYYKIK